MNTSSIIEIFALPVKEFRGSIYATLLLIAIVLSTILAAEWGETLLQRKCVKNRDILQSIGKDVSSVICPQDTSPLAMCIKAVDKLSQWNKDLSHIKCEPTS